MNGKVCSTISKVKKRLEEKELQHYTEGKDGYIEVFLDANEAVSHL